MMLYIELGNCEKSFREKMVCSDGWPKVCRSKLENWRRLESTLKDYPKSQKHLRKMNIQIKIQLHIFCFSQKA